MVKYSVEWEITRNNKELNLSFSPICKYLFMFGQICIHLVYHYLVLSYLIKNDLSAPLEDLIYYVSFECQNQR